MGEDNVIGPAKNRIALVMQMMAQLSYRYWSNRDLALLRSAVDLMQVRKSVTQAKWLKRPVKVFWSQSGLVRSIREATGAQTMWVYVRNQDRRENKSRTHRICHCKNHKITDYTAITVATKLSS